MPQYGSYCTQIGPDGSGHERCGAACIASVLLDDGWDSDPWELTQQVAGQCRVTDRGATVEQMIRCGDGFGLDGRAWISMAEARSALQSGEAVVALLDNRQLVPRTYPPGDAWNAMHYLRVVIANPRDQMLYCYDPLTYQPQPDGSVFQGPISSTTQALLTAIKATPFTESGVIYTSRRGVDLNAR